MVSMKDIVKKCGVSVATVSKGEIKEPVKTTISNGMTEAELTAYQKAQEKKAKREAEKNTSANEQKDNVVPMPQQQDAEDIGA